MGRKTGTELVPADSFVIANRYEGMDPELLAELQDEMGDLEETGIDCRMIRIPAGGGLAYEVQGNEDDDVEYMKEITGVIVFTHRLNGYWPGAYGSGDSGEDKIPICSSMDGKTGIQRDTGEVHTCETCPYNQFGSACDENGGRGKGKACKNMRRLYIMMSNDPKVYMLSVPPTSIKDVNKQLTRIIAGGVPYTGLVVSLKLEKATNSKGIAYSKVAISRKGLLSPDTATRAKELRRQIKEQYQNVAVTFDDYTAADTTAGGAGEAEFTEIVNGDDAPELPFN